MCCKIIIDSSIFCTSVDKIVVENHNGRTARARVIMYALYSVYKTTGLDISARMAIKICLLFMILTQVFYYKTPYPIYR